MRLDKERPEYHRAVAIQENESGKIYAFSTGSQLSSRLLSAKNSNCVVILPKAPSQSDSYTCSGQSSALLLGNIIHKSAQELKALLIPFEGQTVKSSCCPCGHDSG